MKSEFDSSGAEVVILGIDKLENEDRNITDLISTVTLPWLRNTGKNNWWTAWEAQWRDVMILDREGNRVGLINLTDYDASTGTFINDLSNPENYSSLKQLILNTADL